MDADHFDHLSRLVARPVSRRTTAGLAIGLGLAGLTRDHDAAAKKKRKKCRKPTSRCGKGCCVKGECLFKVKGNRWRLQRDCTITRSIEIFPRRSITIDGRGHTISMAGPRTGFTLAGIVVASGETGGRVDFSNLTVNGAGVTGTCAATGVDPGAILLGQTSSRIENVTITGLRCASAIAASSNDGAPPQSITVTGCRVSESPPPGRAGAALNFAGSAAVSLSATVTNSQFTNAPLLFNEGSRATVEGCTMSNSAVVGLNGGRVTVRNNEFTDAIIGISAEASGTVVTATGNTLVGAASEMFQTVGIRYRDDSAGSANGNTISGFACGVQVESGATPTIGANTFGPPPNGQDVCNA
jgi:hypothetical protein